MEHVDGGVLFRQSNRLRGFRSLNLNKNVSITGFYD